ncbi:MAG: glycosyltransferase 87 family protein [Methanomicrobiales archaeon]|nr:glycosyltransferase 87 family protein [Methanomicrobiales archaeon]
MAKKGKKGGREREKGEGRGGGSFTFLGTTFGSVGRETVKRHLIALVLVSLVTKGLVLVLTPAIFRSFIDLFDLGYYLQTAQLLLQGQVPYLSFSFEYPPLVFLPIGLALIPALALQSGGAFVSAFQLLMVLCDLGTLICVYFIALRVWDEKTAWYAGLVYATAFSASYFVLTKYDAFPTLLLMGAILFTVYDKRVPGYVSATLGFFAKVFPAVAFPFMILHNAKTTSLKEEVITAVKVVLPFAVVLFIPFLLLRPDHLNTYLFATGASVGVYAGTATFTLYSYIHDVVHLGLSAGTVSLFMYLLMGLAMLLLLWIGWRDRRKSPVTLLKLTGCAIFAFVLFSKFHSPQYIVWYTPFLALLVAGDLLKTGLFYLVQALAYIEFPLLFGTFYVNLNYLNPAGSGGWYLTLLFFTLEYLALILLFALAVRPEGGFRAALRSYAPESMGRG